MGGEGRTWQKSRCFTRPDAPSSHARKTSTSRSVCGTRISASAPGVGGPAGGESTGAVARRGRWEGTAPPSRACGGGETSPRVGEMRPGAPPRRGLAAAGGLR